MLVQVAISMLAIGLLLGFVGAGGSGFIISILTVGFGYSIHTVLGTALLAMLLSSLSGAFSHYRQGNMRLGIGIIAGIGGAAGAWWSSGLAVDIPGRTLGMLTAGMLILSGAALWARLRYAARRDSVAESTEEAGRGLASADSDAVAEQTGKAGSGLASADDDAVAEKTGKAGGGLAQANDDPLRTPRNRLYALAIGIATGTASGLFGIGSTPFIQLGLIAVLGLSARLAAGTTMAIIVPIALGGGLGYYRTGHLDPWLLAAVAPSIMLGSYLGAKLTGRVPVQWLQRAIVAVPITGGLILLIG
ncbi:sulfite exporter TauE/SafE family protein [Cohnella cellulosilytica]|uniref:Probable membrane transporter protein n=1 Tax=Cohnella cellulosilytica TaxID=986710 RepID=A0ABW2FDU6_9BACL